jgi:glycosyltransferase involved in cell wall biosynthesis
VKQGLSTAARPGVLVAGPLFDHALAARLAGRFELVELAGGPLALGTAVLRGGAAIVHLNGMAHPLPFAVAAKLCGASVLWQIDEAAAADAMPGALTAPFIDAVVVPSAAQADACRKAAPKQLVVHVAPGIDCAPFQRLNRAPYSVDTPLRLIYVGRLEREHGLTETIEALRLVRERRIAARLVIAGHGPEETRLRHQAADSGLARDVVFAGDAEGEHRARLFSQSDVLVFPAYRAGTPRVLLEAMAAGVVPVASAVGGIPEVVDSREQGLLIEPRDARTIADALVALARERATLMRMSAACRKRIAGAFSVERAAAELAALYFLLAAAPRRRERPSKQGRAAL